MDEKAIDRFFGKVRFDGPIPEYRPELGPCWIWGGCTSKGYGRFSMSRLFRNAAAHRVIYEFCIGPIPDGLHMDHLCRVPGCVNPDHLEAVTLAENTRRGNSGVYQKSKTHCPSGHPYDEVNTYISKASDGYVRRHCHTCLIANKRMARSGQAISATRVPLIGS